MNNQDINLISVENLILSVLQLKHDGYRLVQICATTLKKEEQFEITYSFALNETFLCYRIVISQDEEITSISSIFAPAFLYENEMKDLFGIKIKLISLDYDGNFYRIDVKTPFKN